MTANLRTLALGCLGCALGAGGAPALTLADAVAAALANAPELKAAEAQIDAALARQAQAGWQRAGTLETTLLYTPEQRPLSVAFPGAPPLLPPLSIKVPLLDKFSLSGTYTLPLWTWGALEGQHDASRQAVAATRSRTLRSRSATVFEASQAFHQASAAVAGVAVAEAAVAEERAFLATARSRVAAGAAARLDELKAELGLAQAESALLEARNRAGFAREALVSATLEPRFRSADLPLVERAEPSLPEEEEAVRQALATRKDLQASRLQAAALDLEAGAARASGLPALAFRASLTQQNDQMSQMFRTDSQLYAVGLAFTWEAMGSGRGRARAAEAEAQARAMRHQLRGQEEEVSLGVRTALHRVQEARARLQVQDHALAVAVEQARIVRLAYREGAATALEAQEAELALTSARFEHLRARTDAALSAAALGWVMGD